MKNFRQLEYRNCDFIEDDLNIGKGEPCFLVACVRNSNISAMNWFSPETLRTMEFTPKSDIWSFGILMWEMFTRAQDFHQNAISMLVTVFNQHNLVTNR